MDARIYSPFEFTALGACIIGLESWDAEDARPAKRPRVGDVETTTDHFVVVYAHKTVLHSNYAHLIIPAPVLRRRRIFSWKSLGLSGAPLAP